MRNEEVDPAGRYKCFKVDTQYPFKQLENRHLSSDSLPQLDITLLYDFLVQDWLAPLPSDVPTRARLAKEELIRSVSAQLSLARIIILRMPQVRPNNHEHSDPVPCLSDDAKLAFQSEDEGAVRANKEHSRSSSQPTMSEDYEPPSTQPSMMHDSSQLGRSSPFPSSIPSSQPSGQGTMDSPASRLGLYTRIDEQPSLSKDATNILSHWQPGSDPASYDWWKTSRALETEEAEQNLLRRASSSKRKKREARKRIALQQRVDQSGLPSDPATLPSSSVPVIRTPGSKPQGVGTSMLGFPQSSQVTGGFLSSQLEFGNFSQQLRSGPKGKPKKKRAAGF